MDDPSPTTRIDTELLERVHEALANGAAAEPASLAVVLQAPVEAVRQALVAVASYQACVQRALTNHNGHEPSLPCGTRLGDFELDEVLGRGAMGVVYRARQVSLGNRVVALKVLPRSLVARDHRFDDRFRREASLAAAIHHPNLAEVYGFAAVDGTLCFAMRLIEGRTLHQVLLSLSRRQEGPLRRSLPEHVRRCVRLARALADALAEIHARGLMHRDVKPANVLLEGAGADDEEALLARPVLVDFGLLRPVGESELTGTRTLLGTPAYASPECQLGRELDARADVFSLGATLHDLLTMASPGTRGPATAGLPDVRAVNPAVDARLSAIVAMALQERPELRYENGGALRDELDRYLRGEELRAMPASPWGRLQLWVRRDTVRAVRFGTLLAGALVLAAVLSYVLVWAYGADRLAARALRLEAEGDLVQAAAAFGELAAVPRLHWLPWLRPALQHGNSYLDRDGGLRTAIGFLGNAEAALRESGDSATAETNYARAGDRLCEVLLDPARAALSAPAMAFLVREVRNGQPLFRQRIAMDTLANYLGSVVGPQLLPSGLQEDLLARTRGGAPADQDTRMAAVAAYGAIRRPEVMTGLLDCIGAEAAEIRLLAANCTVHLYRWLHCHDPQAFATVTPGFLEQWMLALEQHDRKVGRQELVFTVARHLAWWERPVGFDLQPTRRLQLSPWARGVVERQREQLAAEWLRLGAASPEQWEEYWITSGVAATEFDGSIWRVAGKGDDLAVEAGRDGVTGPTRVSFQPPLTHQPVVISGGVRSARIRSAEVVAWETGSHIPAYLLFARPGASRFGVVVGVPEGARGLEIVLHHMKGGRPVLRNDGNVALRVRLVGQGFEQIVTAPGGREREQVVPRPFYFNATTKLDVPVHLLWERREIELEVEYLYGNTTYRLVDVGFEWR